MDTVPQMFEGVVIDVDLVANDFAAQFTDLTHPDLPDEIMVLSIDDIQPGDVDDIEVGCLLSWRIEKIGTNPPSSIIELKRIPVLTADQLLNARLYGETIYNRLHGTLQED